MNVNKRFHLLIRLRMSQNIPQTYPKQGSGYSRGLYSYERRSMRGFGSMVKNMIAQSYIHVFNK